MFCLKISVFWKMGMSSGQCAEMLHYMCWFSPPQRHLYMGCPTPCPVSYKEKKIDVSDLEIFGEKCCLQPVLITDLLLQNHGVDQLLPALLWGCLRPGSRLEHMALLFVPHCVCRAVWPDLLLIYLPDNSSSLEEVMRTSWPYQTLSHPNSLSPPHPPTTFMLLSLV